MNITVILAVVVGLILTHAGAFWKGMSHEETKQKAAYSKQLEKAIADHEQTALVDMQAAWEAATELARYKTQAKTTRAKLDSDIARAPSACRLDDVSFGLLLDTVKAANGETGPSNSVPLGLRPPRDAGKPKL
jgi:hypothetical protein